MGKHLRDENTVFNPLSKGSIQRFLTFECESSWHSEILEIQLKLIISLVLLSGYINEME